MKKTLFILSFMFVFILVGCDLQIIYTTDNTEISTTQITTNGITDLITSEEISNQGTSGLTTEEILTTESPVATDSAMLDIYLELIDYLPEQISSNHPLPFFIKKGLSITYYINNEELTDFIPYEAKSYNEIVELYILINFEGNEQSYVFEIEQLRDELLYQQALTDQVFEEIFDEIAFGLPTYLTSDLTLPSIDLENVEISYSVNQSYIFNQRLIFTFPEEEEEIRLTAIVHYKDEYREKVYTLTMAAYGDLPNIPRIYITTDNQAPIESKEEYVYGQLSLYEYNEFNEAITILDGVEMGIRLRGNSTMYMPKLPYKIKFTDKQYMFGDYKEKDWVLLANFADQSLVRNALAYQMAENMDMAFAPMVQFVDVYINGVYQGNYMLTDQIEVTNDRVDIDEKSSDIDTGYLLEYDFKVYEEGVDLSNENYFIIDGIPFVLKAPDIEKDYYSHDQYLYIQNYMQSLFNILKNQQDYTGWIDEDSFVDWFIINEVFKNVDSGYSSVYYYKDKGGILSMGPVWDFDLSSGNYGHLGEDLRGPEGWYTGRFDKNILFYYLMQYDSFKSALKERWNDVYDDVIVNMIDSIYPMVDSIAKSRYDNFVKWDVIGHFTDWYIAPEILALDSYEAQVYFLRTFLIDRVDWLNSEINQFD